MKLTTLADLVREFFLFLLFRSSAAQEMVRNVLMRLLTARGSVPFRNLASSTWTAPVLDTRAAIGRSERASGQTHHSTL